MTMFYLDIILWITHTIVVDSLDDREAGKSYSTGTVGCKEKGLTAVQHNMKKENKTHKMIRF